MFRLFGVLGAVALFALAGRAADPLEFKELASKEGRYKVLMPGKPELSEKKNKDLVIYSATLKLPPNKFLSVSYFDLPTEIPATQAQGTLKLLTAGVKGKEIKTEEKALGKAKLPAREAIFEAEKGVHVRNFLVLDGKRVYQLVLAGPSKDEVTSKDADKFFDSFEVVK